MEHPDVIQNRKNRVRANKNYDQCKGMLKYAPGAAGMYVQAIAKDTELTSEQVVEIIKADME